MSASIKTNLKKLSKMKDSKIDYSDIPETDMEFWREAKVSFPEKKVHLSIRLDHDIVNWFKQFGKGYQTKINAVLRSYIENIQKRQAPKST